MSIRSDRLKELCGQGYVNDARYVKMFSSDFNHVELVDAPDAVRVLVDRLSNARSVPWSDHARRQHPSEG